MPKKTQHPTPDPPRVSVLMATQTPTSKSKLTPGQELCEIQRSEPIPPTSGCPISKSTHSDGSPVGYPIRMLRFVCGGVSVIARVPGDEGGKPSPLALSGKGDGMTLDRWCSPLRATAAQNLALIVDQ